MSRVRHDQDPNRYMMSAQALATAPLVKAERTSFELRPRNSAARRTPKGQALSSESLSMAKFTRGAGPDVKAWRHSHSPVVIPRGGSTKTRAAAGSNSHGCSWASGRWPGVRDPCEVTGPAVERLVMCRNAQIGAVLAKGLLRGGPRTVAMMRGHGSVTADFAGVQRAPASCPIWTCATGDFSIPAADKRR